ncbi:unnamed protein product, partial [Clonostachys rosea f. rosea IK726]
MFGFAAFKLILVAEGVYYNLCDDQAESAQSLFTGVDDHTPCDKQDATEPHLCHCVHHNQHLMSTRWPCSRPLRSTGLWIASCPFIAIGSLLIGQSFLIPRFDGYVACNMLLGLGGTFLFVPSFQLANAFPKHSGLVAVIITGGFNASSSVFLFYRIAYEAFDGSLSPEIFFFGYIIVPILILVAEVSIIPSYAYHTTAQLEAKIEKASDQIRDIHISDGDISDSNELIRVRSTRSDRRKAKLDKLEEIAGDTEYREARIRAEEERQETSGIWGILYGISAHRQILTPWYILILLLIVLQIIRINYFITTISSQYRYILGSEEASTINHFFNTALPMGGVLSTPLISLILNNLSVPITFRLLTGFTVAIGVFNCAGYITVITFIIFRPLYYSAISDYTTKVFRFATFSRIYRTLICFSGLVSFTQTGLNTLIYSPLGGDPTPVNTVLSAIGIVIGITLTAFVLLKSREGAREQTEREQSQQEQQRLIFGGNKGYSIGI